MTTIHKTEYTLTVLHESGDQPADIEQAVIAAFFEGKVIGQQTSMVTVAVPDAQVSDELIELGNDGRFFDWVLAGGR